MAAINLASLIVGIVAGIATIIVSVNIVREHRKITWKTVETGTRKIIGDIQRSGFHPDLVIGVGRGGSILAGMLAGNLGHLPLFVIDTVLDRSSGISAAHVRYPNLLPEQPVAHILLAVGELYSGEDLKAALMLVRTSFPNTNIKTVSLFTHPAASIRPDYLGKETKQPMSAPWRMSDIYRARRL